MTAIKPFPVGCVVLTPTGRRAKVMRYVGKDDPRCELQYEDAKPMGGQMAETDLVVLRPGLLKLAPKVH